MLLGSKELEAAAHPRGGEKLGTALGTSRGGGSGLLCWENHDSLFQEEGARGGGGVHLGSTALQMPGFQSSRFKESRVRVL